MKRSSYFNIRSYALNGYSYTVVLTLEGIMLIVYAILVKNGEGRSRKVFASKWNKQSECKILGELCMSY